MERVLVSGATGFIGRQLCPVLLERGYAVRGVHRTEQPPDWGGKTLEWCRIPDVHGETSWDGALQGVHYVIHLAGLAHQIGKKVPAQSFFRINAEGTRRLAEAAVASGTVRRLVFVSSIAAVSSLRTGAVVETGGACEPDTDYGRSKLAGEAALAAVMKDTQADWCVLRPVLVYGPEDPGNMTRLLRLIQTGLPLPLASVCNRRSFLYVGNLVELLVLALSHPAASRRGFNVSDGESLSTPDLLRLIARVTNRPLRLVPCPEGCLRALGKLGDLGRKVLGRSLGVDSYSVERLLGSLVVEIEPLKNLLGWRPPFSLEAGFRRTLTSDRA